MNPSVYKRPDKPRTMVVTRRRDREAVQPLPNLPEPVTVDAATECHVTPPEVAARMVDYLEYHYPTRDTTGSNVLEPSAGTGNLIQAMVDADILTAHMMAVERHAGLTGGLTDRFGGFLKTHNRCFLEFAEEWQHEGGFDRIIMNPPFRKVKQHMAAAISLLKPGGVLVALVPCTYQHPEASVLEDLGPDTFVTAKVRTKIIRLG